MSDTLKINVNYLPLSQNKYLAPRVRRTSAGAFPYMNETPESKDWKRLFKTDLKRAVVNQNFNKELTKDGHWFLECKFVLSRTNQDCANFFKILLDAMTGIAINDDRNILPRVHKISYDPNNPRTQLILRKTDWEGLFNSSEERDELIESQCSKCRFYRNGGCSLLKAISEGRESEEYCANKNLCMKYVEKKHK